MSWKEGVWNFLSREKPVCISECCEKHLPLTSFPQCVLHFSFLNTLCSLSIISQSVCLTGIVWRKKGKKNKKGHNCQAPLIETARSFWIVREEGRERDALPGMSVSLQQGVCVCVCVKHRDAEQKEAALSGEWYTAKWLFTLMTSGAPLHHRPIHSFHPIQTAPAGPCRPLNSPSPHPLAHLVALRFCCRVPSAALASMRSC